jgi:hypothetical protein
MAKRTKVEAQGLKDGNKAVKTLSGAITQVKTFWSKGYKTAFTEIGVTFEMLDYKKLEPMMQKDGDGIIYTVEAVRIKDENDNYIKDEKGHYKKEEQDVPVTVWTANKLFDCLKQSLNK